MKFEEAIERINDINYDMLDNTIKMLKFSEDDEKKYRENVELYLYRLAYFCKKNRKDFERFRFYFLSTVNVYEALGYEHEDNVLGFCSDDVTNFYKEYSIMKNVVEQYLLLTKANEYDETNNLDKYIRIFEPMIDLLENGILFYDRGGRELDIPLLGRYVMNGVKWSDLYHERLQKRIEEGIIKLEDVDC